MLDVLILSVVMVFFAIGIYFTVKEIISLLVNNSVPVRVVVEVTDNAEAAENTIREVMAANPNGDIVAVNRGESDEVRAVLERLAADNIRLHIIYEKEARR